MLQKIIIKHTCDHGNNEQHIGVSTKSTTMSILWANMKAKLAMLIQVQIELFRAKGLRAKTKMKEFRRDMENDRESKTYVPLPSSRI